MDALSFIGVLLSIASILIGQYLEGGSYLALINGPAFIIVIGGTLGAVLLETPLKVFYKSLLLLKHVFLPVKINNEEYIAKVVFWSNIARKRGLLELENSIAKEDEEFNKKALSLLVDGRDATSIRDILQNEIDLKLQHDLKSAKVYESFGGYSPTIGIIGAVLGLIQVMNNLSDPSKLGHGIAVAFVATIYGIGVANIFCLPVAKKLNYLLHSYSVKQEIVAEGVSSIADGENPKLIEAKLQGFL